MVKPNLFLVGAPKCGTTYLANLLGRHPKIGMSVPKEPHFFARDLLPPTSRYIRDERAYLQLFDIMEGKTWRAEASTWYLVSETAASEIHQYSPGARIIAVVREPISQMYSLFSHRVYGGNEDTISFREALSLENERAHGKFLPKNLSNTATGLQYTRAASHGTNLQRFIRVFGRENVEVVFLDELKERSSEVLGRVFGFLDLNNISIPLDAEKNPNKRNRTLWMQGLISFVPVPIKKSVRSIIGGKGIAKVNALLSNFNGRRPRFDLADDEITAILSRFENEIRSLEEITGRNLDQWRV